MSDRLVLDVRPASVPVAVEGWYLAYGYGTKPLVLYARRGLTIWRDGIRHIPVTRYAGPIPELS